MNDLSIKGATNVAKFIESISDTSMQTLVSLDGFQAGKEPSERFYTVEVIYPELEGGFFQAVEE